ncbi:dynein regulatory complex subunit [Pacmanvirus S19]|nr:dynein regulatory complex subunit [Pacmanvirus S19]
MARVRRGKRVQRKIILKKLAEMKNGSIKIPECRITCLPDSPLWKNVTHFTCYDTPITTLPELPNLISLDIMFTDITTLPEMPNLKQLICSENEITHLPELPNVEYLNCANNQLTTLPELPNVVYLDCSNNRLTALPKLSNVKDLICHNNQLLALPELPNIEYLLCVRNNLTIMPKIYKTIKTKYYNTNLFYYNPRFNNIHWSIIDFITLKIYVTRWRKFNSESVKAKKQDLHNELLYSPDLPFYKQTEEYQHWLVNTS